MPQTSRKHPHRADVELAAARGDLAEWPRRCNPRPRFGPRGTRLPRGPCCGDGSEIAPRPEPYTVEWGFIPQGGTTGPVIKARDQGGSMPQILLIDDDDAVREVLARILRDAGHAVTAYAWARDALAAADTRAFDVVLTDVLMPDMDGVEVIRAFARRCPRPRLIAMTGGST